MDLGRHSAPSLLVPRWIACLLGILVLASCHKLAAYPLAQVPDASPSDRGRPNDGSPDGILRDSAADGSGDGDSEIPADAAGDVVDSAFGDTSLDVGSDALPTPDRRITDLPSDTTVPSWLPGTVVVPRVGSTQMTQCDAASVCPPGMHLCTASEYLAAGGRSIEAPGSYWLASCVRHAGAPFPPSDGDCGGGCVLVTDNNAPPASWNCINGASLTYSSEDTGVQTDNLCHRLGVDHTDNAAYWKIVGSNSQWPDGALCCQ